MPCFPPEGFLEPRRGRRGAPVDARYQFTGRSIEIRHSGEVVMASAQMSPRQIGEGHTALMRAALEGDTEAVTALLRRCMDVNARDDEGRTALMFAAINMHAATVEALLDYGADVNARAGDGGTALMLAAIGGHVGIVQALLDKGADTGGKFYATGRTAVMLAADRGYTAIVRLLKQAGAQG